jgi:hypothetical protein
MTRFSESQIQYVKDNYVTMGPEPISKILGVGKQPIYRLAKRMGLTCKGEVGKYVIDLDKFTNITEPEIAYFLGFFWADGHISESKNKSSYLTLTFVKTDFIPLEKTLTKYINWNVRFKIPPNRQEVVVLGFRGYRLGQFLIDHGYIMKSGGSPEKIINSIPEYLRHYWFRGYFDGDGTVRKNKGRCAFSSTINQDWTFLISLCQKLNIEYSVYKNISPKNHKSSTFDIHGYKDASVLLKYIYRDLNVDKIGLPRKAARALNLIKHYDKLKEEKTSAYIGIEFNKARQKWRAHGRIFKKTVYLGAFETEEDAITALVNFNGPDKSLKKF